MPTYEVCTMNIKVMNSSCVEVSNRDIYLEVFNWGNEMHVNYDDSIEAEWDKDTNQIIFKKKKECDQ